MPLLDHADGNARRLPLLVFAAGLLLTAAIWLTVRAHEQSQLRWATGGTA